MVDAVVTERTLDDGTVVIELRGELDLAVNDALTDVLVDVITTRRPPRLEVSMRHVTFADSTGMGALLAGYNAAQAAGVEYVVRDAAPFVERQLRATGTYELLVAHPAPEHR